MRTLRYKPTVEPSGIERRSDSGPNTSALAIIDISKPFASSGRRWVGGYAIGGQGGTVSDHNGAANLLPIEHENSEWHGRVILGYLMRSSNGCDRFAHIGPDLFSSDQHRRIFLAIANVRNANHDINLVSVSSALKAAGDFATVGGVPAVTSIYTEEYGTPETVEYAIRELAEASARRRAAVIGQSLADGEVSVIDAINRLDLIKVPIEHRVPRIRFFRPSELRDYDPDAGVVLIGNCHVMRGEVFVIGGEPGVGKSRAATALAVSGATGCEWFGLPVHRKFRTMIVQTENGRYRLQQEFSALDCGALEEWIRVSEPPPFGLTLSNPEFQQDIRAALESFKPDCVILDPWNAAAKDDKQRDYSEAFDALRQLLPTGNDKPALGIVAHTRKPQPTDKRTGGTGLMHLLSGSYMLSSVPRAVFIMVRGNEDETDDAVLWLNPKNNNGEHAARSAWHRKASGFTPSPDFDWSEFEKPPTERKTVTLDHLREVFDGSSKRLELAEAAHRLATLVGINSGSAYNALSQGGRFAEHLSREGKFIAFKA